MGVRALARPQARRLPDGRFELRRGRWSGCYPWSSLPAWIRFYRGLRDRGHPVAAETYGPMVRRSRSFWTLIPNQPEFGGVSR